MKERQMRKGSFSFAFIFPFFDNIIKIDLCEQKKAVNRAQIGRIRFFVNKKRPNLCEQKKALNRARANFLGFGEFLYFFFILQYCFFFSCFLFKY